MKPLIMQFAEPAAEENVDMATMEYNKDLNLTVIKGTSVPAVHNNLTTETLTKSNGEGSDSDHDYQQDVSILMATSTQTRQMLEACDSDKGFRNMQYLMSTQTLTEVRGEGADSDR